MQAFPAPFSTLARLLAGQAALRPDAVAFQFEGVDLGYAALDQWARQLAARLAQEWRVRPGDRVAWLGGNHVAQFALLFALARLGAILLPLNFRLAPAEWDAMLADCQPRHLVHDESWAAAAQDLAPRHSLQLHAAAGLAGQGDWPAPVQEGSGDSPVLLVYTSGTTSRAKAAVHTQANLLANMAIAAEVQRMTADDIVATVLPIFHVGGLCIQTLPALYAGARILLHPRFSAEATLACISNERPTLTLQVPATMKALVEHPDWPGTDLSSLRAVWAGSSLLPAPLIQAFHARGVPVCNVYGATETGPFSIALPPEHAMTHLGSCGWPAPRVEVAQSSAGELLVRAPNVVRHYWPQQPACDEEGWFHTGDLAARAADGSYRIVGRARDLIISGGENIHPAEIEARLAEHPAVAECAAFGCPDAQWGEVVAIAVVLRPGAQASQDELNRHLQGQLARFKLPRRWLWPAALPKTALGKVQRQDLARQAQAVFALEASHTSSSTGTPSRAVAVKKLT